MKYDIRYKVMKIKREKKASKYKYANLINFNNLLEDIN